MLTSTLLTVLGALLIPVANAQLSQISPSGNYTPSRTACPSNHTFIRPAQEGLSVGEAKWRKTRLTQVLPALEAYLTKQAFPDFCTDLYIEALKNNTDAIPKLALAISGGGTRSEIIGLGVYNALDGRNNQSVAAGTGGLTQALTYVAGLSGGTLATSGLAINGFPLLADLYVGGQLNITPNALGAQELPGKAKAGFNLTVADINGAFGLYNFFKVSGSKTDPLGWTYSGIQAQESFMNGSVPMPIIMAIEVIPEGLPSASYGFSTPNGTILLPDTDPSMRNDNASLTVYEYTPFEFGSWTGRVRAFADIQYLGSPLHNGKPVNSSECVVGYDNAAFVTGTVVTAYNYWTGAVLTNDTSGQFAKRSFPVTTPSRLNRRLKRSYPGQAGYIPYPPQTVEDDRIVETLSTSVGMLPTYEKLLMGNLTDIIYARIVNPFYGAGTDEGISGGAGTQQELMLVDGGESGQENPLWPLIQPAREVDLIVVVDACGSELASGWMNGTNLVNTYTAAKAAGLPFPQIPPVNTLLNLNLTAKPVLFGCNEPDVPIVLYAADYPYSSYTNLSELVNGFTNTQLEIITDNSIPLMSQNSNQLAPNWTQCIACAAIERSLSKIGFERTVECDACFKEYCWQGNTDNAQPSYLEPYLVLNDTLSWTEWNATVFY